MTKIHVRLHVSDFQSFYSDNSLGHFAVLIPIVNDGSDGRRFIPVQIESNFSTLAHKRQKKAIVPNTFILG